jgi:mRNA interferase RelE/StbE
VDVLYESSFAKDLKRVKDKQLLNRVQNAIKEIKAANELAEVRNLKKLQGYDTFYRLRLGDYRIGIEVEGNNLC